MVGTSTTHTEKYDNKEKLSRKDTFIYRKNQKRDENPSVGKFLNKSLYMYLCIDIVGQRKGWAKICAYRINILIKYWSFTNGLNYVR